LSTAAASLVQPTVEALNAEARRLTGLDDFGPNTFDEPLRVLLDCILCEGNLTEVGLQRGLQSMIKHLSSRLRMQEFFAQHPEIEDQPIVAPVVIIGMQRTGTSKLFGNIAADPQWNVLYTWQALNPIPPAGWEPGMPDGRLAEAEAFCEQQRFMAQAHKFEARSPEMEALLISQCFMVSSGQYLIPTHHKWLETADFNPVYRQFKRQLQFLQWQNRSQPGRRWILKTPGHLFALDALLKVFPDAKLVMTHRHPRSSVGSMCKLVEITQQQVAKSIDCSLIGKTWLRIMAFSIDNFMRLYAREGTSRVINVDYRDLTGDPLPAIRRIYDFAEMPFTAQTEEAAARWHAENPQHSEGKFQYALADYGIDDGDIEVAFANYLQAFADLIR
jgi:hypothetical protein